jgi:hypothetical protein
LRDGLHGTYYEQYWNTTRQAIIDGAKNYVFSFLPTPIDPAVQRMNNKDLPLFFGNRDHFRRLEEDTTDDTYTASDDEILLTTETKTLDDGGNSTSSESEFGDVIYPEPFLDPQFVQYGGFMLYLIGIMYSFLGISLIT